MNTTPANEQPENENAPSQTPEKKTIEQQLEEEMKKWQTKIDEVKVQLNLAAMDAKDKAQPHIDQLEQEMAKGEGVAGAQTSLWRSLAGPQQGTEALVQGDPAFGGQGQGALRTEEGLDPAAVPRGLRSLRVRPGASTGSVIRQTFGSRPDKE